MNWKQRLATWKPVTKKSKRRIVAGILAVSLLLCGFSWTWFVEFTARVLFPVQEAIDTDMILNFENYVNTDDLQLYLTEPVNAEQVVQGIQSNLSENIYQNIGLPDMTQESLGKMIIRTIFDRLFT